MAEWSIYICVCVAREADEWSDLYDRYMARRPENKYYIHIYGQSGRHKYICVAKRPVNE